MIKKMITYLFPLILAGCNIFKTDSDNFMKYPLEDSWEADSYLFAANE